MDLRSIIEVINELSSDYACQVLDFDKRNTVRNNLINYLDAIKKNSSNFGAETTAVKELQQFFKDHTNSVFMNKIAVVIGSSRCELLISHFTNHAQQNHDNILAEMNARFPEGVTNMATDAIIKDYIKPLQEPKPFKSNIAGEQAIQLSGIPGDRSAHWLSATIPGESTDKIYAPYFNCLEKDFEKNNSHLFDFEKKAHQAMAKQAKEIAQNFTNGFLPPLNEIQMIAEASMRTLQIYRCLATRIVVITMDSINLKNRPVTLDELYNRLSIDLNNIQNMIDNDATRRDNSLAFTSEDVDFAKKSLPDMIRNAKEMKSDYIVDQHTKEHLKEIEQELAEQQKIEKERIDTRYKMQITSIVSFSKKSGTKLALEIKIKNLKASDLAEMKSYIEENLKDDPQSLDRFREAISNTRPVNSNNNNNAFFAASSSQSSSAKTGSSNTMSPTNQ